MRASSDDLVNLENGRNSRYENIELKDSVQDSGPRQSAYAESLFSQGKKMRASSDDLMNVENGRDSRHENNEQRDSAARQSDYAESVFFGCGDDKKKIDFVLVYERGSNADEENKKAATRKIYQDNLEKKHGLILDDSEILSQDGNEVHFVKVHAPLETLFKHAEELMIRMPIKNAENLSPKDRSPKDDPPKDRSPKDDSPKDRSPKDDSPKDRSPKDDSPKDRSPKDDPPDQKKWPEIICTFRDLFVNKPVEKPVTATFSCINKSSFRSKNGELFFDTADRCRMVYRILQMTSLAEENVNTDTDDSKCGIDSLCDDEIYTACYPLHDGPSVQKGGHVANDRQKLRTDWSSFRRIFKYQPINAVRRYFGTRIAFYYAWLGVYIAMLVPAAFVGVLCFIYGLASLNTFEPIKDICDKKNEKLFYMCPKCDKYCSFWSLSTSCDYAKVGHLFDNGATVFFSVFMSIWATLFLEIWKRTQVRLSYEWDVYNLIDEYEPSRPQFLLSTNDLPQRQNPVTGKDERYIPSWTRFKRTLGGLGIIFFMGSVVIASIAGIVVYRATTLAALYLNSNNDIRRNAKLVISFTAAIMNLVFIKILSFVYVKIAVILTDWENPRTKSEYQNALTFKMYFFEFVNTYSSLFYIAFFKSSLIIGKPTEYSRLRESRIEGCDPSGCLIDLCIQLSVIMVGKQFLGFGSEFILPSAVRAWKKWRHRKEKKDEEKKDEEKKILSQCESDYFLNPEPDFRMFYEYLEMVIQFGFVTMFVASFPLAPLFALLNNIFELRADATNFAVNFRRPVAEEVKNIGVWFGILEIVTKISVLVNSFVIAFTTDFVPRLVYMYGYSPDGTLKGYVNNSLAYINVSDLEQHSVPSDTYKHLNYTLPYCRFKEYLKPYPPYDYSEHYLHVTLARVLFVLFFQYVVFFVKDLLAWLVPDVPKSLEEKIKRENHVARLCLRKSELQATQETPCKATSPLCQSCEALVQPEISHC